MLIRNQESHLRVVDLDPIGTRMCQVSVTLSVGEENRTKGLVDLTLTADRGEPQAIGCMGYRELVADPTTNFRWTSTLHMSVMAGSLWNCPQDVQCLEISHWGSILGVMISESI